MRKTILLLALSSLLLFVGACGDEPAGPLHSEQLDAQAHIDGALPLPKWGPTDPDVLASLEWEDKIWGTIVPGEGGILVGQPETWPPGCYFSIQVPPGALPDDDGDPIEFSLQVPTYQDFMNNQHLNGGLGLPLEMHMEPSGINFLEPVTVTATYMPWTSVTKKDLFGVWTIDPEYDDGYGILWARSVNRTMVQFSYTVPHFSRWGVGAPKEVPPE